jgi:hypothetical protein
MDVNPKLLVKLVNSHRELENSQKKKVIYLLSILFFHRYSMISAGEALSTWPGLPL